MMPNPLSDTWNFLIGNTGDYNNLGPAKYVSVAFFLALLAGSVAVAATGRATRRSAPASTFPSG